MSREEQEGANQGEPRAQGSRPLRFDLRGPGWKQCGKMSNSSAFTQAVFFFCLRPLSPSLTLTLHRCAFMIFNLDVSVNEKKSC